MTATLTFEGHEIDVQVLRLQPGDRVVLSPRRLITREQAHQVEKHAKTVFPGHEVVVLNEIDLAVDRSEEAAT